MVSGQKRFAVIMGLILMARGLLGFMVPGKMFGMLSTSPDHNFLHILAGTCLIWAGVYAKPTSATGWNKFVGWFYLVVGTFGLMNIGFLAQHMNENTFIDNAFNFLVAGACVAAGHFGKRIRHIGVSFMEAAGWPYGKT